MQERNLCSQGRTWQKCMQTSFRFLHVSSNQEHNGSCSNLVPRALFPGFGGGPGKSDLGTSLCFLRLTPKRGLFLYKIRDTISTPYSVTIRRWSRLDTSPHALRSAAVFFPFFSGEREIWRRHIRRAQSQDRTSLDQIYTVDSRPRSQREKPKTENKTEIYRKKFALLFYINKVIHEGSRPKMDLSRSLVYLYFELVEISYSRGQRTRKINKNFMHFL